ncbi:MAG: Hydrogenase maturation factor HypC [Phycisphaerae bacterium]|nr:Hydrogenase maturation factor HypC [Phycisphaerae bacterium]
MCLAVPGQIVEARGDEAIADLNGNRFRISTVLTPDVGIGDWVLVHAGFAISPIAERDALETWEYLRGEGVVEVDVTADAGERVPAAQESQPEHLR